MMTGRQNQIATSKYALDLHDATSSRVNHNLCKVSHQIYYKFITSLAHGQLLQSG